MRRIKATQTRTGLPTFIDLDACPVIVRGEVNFAQDAPMKPCTLLYTGARHINGAGVIEYVEETPEELFALPVVV